MASLSASPAWRALAAHYPKVASLHMRDLFAADGRRFERCSLRLGELLLDYSKNRITGETMTLLVGLARAADVEGWRERMFGGERINGSENRAVLHVALRNRSRRPIRLDGEDVMPGVIEGLRQMRGFSDAVGDGRWTGATGQPIAAVVNIGIGGSDLGPALVTEALTPYHRPGLKVRFVSNVDGTHIAETLKGLRPETTLFIVASKTFTTRETLANAATAKGWIAAALGQAAVRRHFVAVTADRERALAFGVDPANVFALADWVGGRFSLWSAVGLPIAIAVGIDRFEELLEGAHAVDEHFRSAPLESNLPVVLALLGVWHTAFFAAASHAVLPYDQYLRRLPAFLQQLEMESNGKSVGRDGRRLDVLTAPVVFGDVGTNGQHAFFQLLHQGSRLVPADFIAAAESHNPVAGHHPMLVANFLAQTEALMRGKTAEAARAELAAAGVAGEDLARLLPHKVFEGNRPTNSIVVRRFDPRTLGMLIALYEHKVFVQGVIWGINSFDQWGVEFGKELADAILPELADDRSPAGHDSSTTGLINHFKRLKAGTP